MRAILFRGKDVINGEWHYGYYVRRFDDCIIHSGVLPNDYYIVKPETVGQYAGLKDKNGKKIFEGDIVTCDYFCGVVHLYEGGWCVTEKDNYPEYLYDLINLKVIGNIHDNSELIKE